MRKDSIFFIHNGAFTNSISCIIAIILAIFPILAPITTTAQTTTSNISSTTTSTSTQNTIAPTIQSPNSTLTSTSSIIALANKIPSNFQFNNDLGYGLYSNDVYILQLLLNTDTRTIISPTGYGSPGNESNFYGLLTQNAVSRFQEIHRQDILTPSVLNYPTGKVGPLTRSVLNRMIYDIKAFAYRAGVGSSGSNLNSSGTSSRTPTDAELTAYINNQIYGNPSGGYNPTAPSQGSSSGKTNTTGLVVAGAVVVGAVAVSAASKATDAIKTSFGGNIVYIEYCTCMASALLYIYDKSINSVIQLMYIPGASSMKLNYNIFTTGVNVLGGYTPVPGVQCMVYDGEECSPRGAPIGVIDFFRGIGSSAF